MQVKLVFAGKQNILLPTHLKWKTYFISKGTKLLNLLNNYILCNYCCLFQ